jgi:hypothetical protein
MSPIPYFFGSPSTLREDISVAIFELALSAASLLMLPEHVTDSQ